MKKMVKDMKLLHVLPLPPMGTNHAYHTSGGRWYKDSKVVSWEKECLYMLMGSKKFKKDNYTVNIAFFDKDKRRRDIDGRIKSVLDLLTKANFYEDDSLVDCLIVYKRFDKENPRLEIEVY